MNELEAPRRSIRSFRVWSNMQQLGVCVAVLAISLLGERAVHAQVAQPVDEATSITEVAEEPGGGSDHEGAPTSADSAGRAAVEPGAASGPGTVELQLRSAPGVSFHEGKGRKRRRLCSGTCSLQFAPGALSLSLSVPGMDPIGVGTIRVAEPSVLEGAYRSRAPQRAAFGALGGVGVVAGLGFLGRGGVLLGEINDACGDAGGCKKGPARARLIAGAISLVLGVVFSTLALVRDDVAELHVRPTQQARQPSIAESTKDSVEVDDATRTRDLQTLARARALVVACLPSTVTRLEIHLDPQGAVASVDVEAPPSVHACVLRALQSMRFEAGPSRTLVLRRR